MNITKVKFGWSYDLCQTEKWLEEMASQGWMLEKIYPTTRKFSFKKAKPCKISFHLYFSKEKQLSNRLHEEGWREIDAFGHWHILANDKPPAEIKVHPARDGLLKRNTWHSYGYLFILIMFAMMLFQFITIGLAFSFGVPTTIEPSPLWAITFVYFLLVICLILLSIRNLRLIKKTATALTYGKNETIKHIQGKQIKKYRFYWTLEPDRLESWLEKMAEDGYQLVRVGNLGVTYYFTKAKKENRVFIADYQINPEPYYQTLHTENGWELVFQSKYSFTKWTIWSKAYDDEKPKIYHSLELRIKQAKKVCYMNGILLGYMLLVNGWLLYLSLSDLENMIFSLTCAILSCSIVLIMTIKALSYFLRLRTTQ